jgi:F-type H+-transporting ATPase subunit delta
MSTQGDKLAKTIISYLKGAKHLDLLPEVVEALVRTPEYKKSQHKVVITSALKLEASELKRLESYVAKQIGNAYLLETKVDPTLVAGFTLQIDDTLTDASFLGKIETIQNTLNAKE